jgi:acetylxylan esterase
MISVQFLSFSTLLSLAFFSTYTRAIPGPQANIPVNVDPARNTSSSTACADVHVIVVRASTEEPGQGIIGTL